MRLLKQSELIRSPRFCYSFAMGIAVDSFFLSPDARGTLQAQIRQMIAQGILSGHFRRGEKLPSTRKLAAHLGVSRITVTLAYTELEANDYLTSRGRSGFFVSPNAPDPPVDAPRDAPPDTINWSEAIGTRYSQSSVPEKPLDWRSYEFPFLYGQADPSLFDHANWRHCALRALGARDFSALTSDLYDQDDPLLLEFLARHTLPRRGILAQPDQILITMGAQNALWLAAQILLTPERVAVLENPGYPALREILAQQGSQIAPVPIDREGLDPGLLPKRADVIFTTPSHQCPTTTTMPVSRRRDLLQAAREREALIVEDDYEFEMSFLHPPSPALKSLDREGRVIYVGSFSKSLFPGLRLGYLVGSAPFIREARALRASVLRHPPGHIQRTVAYFLSLGHYDALIRRVSRALHTRRTEMERAIAAHGLKIVGQGVSGGSSFWMQGPLGVNADAVAKRLRGEGVLIEGGAAYYLTKPGPQQFYRLAYTSIASEKMDEGIRRIASAFSAEASAAEAN